MAHVLRYLLDEHGNRTAVVLPIADYDRLLEDLEDLAVVAERRDDLTLGHEEIVSEFKVLGEVPKFPSA